MRKAQSFEHWKNEQKYITSVNAKTPDKTFNYDRKVFAQYCNSQANFCLSDGFRLIANVITQSRDIANPTFRSETRHQGGEVLGIWAFHSGKGPFDKLREQLRNE